MHRNVQALTSNIGMAMIHASEVKEKIAAVLADEISVMDFVRWIMSNSWNMHQDSSPEAVDLVSKVHLLLAERDDFSLNDHKFLQELGALLESENEPHVISLHIAISFAPAQHVATIERRASVVAPLVFPEIQVLLY